MKQNMLTAINEHLSRVLSQKLLIVNWSIFPKYGNIYNGETEINVINQQVFSVSMF